MPDIDELLGKGAPPLIAILRGLLPADAAETGRALLDAGIRIIEVPANSPGWQDSVATLADTCGDRALIGAGTILTPAMVDEVARAGGRLVVAPNTDTAVIGRAVALGFDVLPGVLTPTEAFAAIAAGARRLKLFPAASVPVSHLSALRDVLPEGTGIWAVGGVDPDGAARWLEAGAQGVATGSALFRPGRAIADIAQRAAHYVAALDKL